MRDIDLYQQVLGLAEPWFVERVELSVPEKKVDIWVAHRPEAKWPCSQCDEAPIGYDHAPERTWRHLDTCQFQTLLHARVPRVTCPAHGVVQVAVPWAEARSRFTLLFDRFHIMGHMNEAVDKVRRQEHRALMKGSSSFWRIVSPRSPWGRCPQTPGVYRVTANGKFECAAMCAAVDTAALGIDPNAAAWRYGRAGLGCRASAFPLAVGPKAINSGVWGGAPVIRQSEEGPDEGGAGLAEGDEIPVAVRGGEPPRMAPAGL